MKEAADEAVDEAVDVVVLGSGAAGLVAAIATVDAGASVALFEKSDLVGGTSAMSGGVIWMPNNHHQGGSGIDDSREKALAYLESLSLGQIDSDMAATFVDTGPEVLRYLEERTPCGFRLIATYPDYHPEHPGGLPSGGRSLDNELFAFTELGEWADRVRNHRGTAPLMLIETPLGGATSMPEGAVIGERIKAKQNGMGLGLVGALLRGALDRGIEPEMGARARHLVVTEGRVTGVALETPSGQRTVSARQGRVRVERRVGSYVPARTNDRPSRITR